MIINHLHQAQFEADKRQIYKHPLFPLLALLFQPAGAESSGYGAPAAEYGAPAPAYGAPEYRSVGDSTIPNHVSFDIILWTFSRMVFPDLERGG